MKALVFFLLISSFSFSFDTPQEAENHLFDLLEQLRTAEDDYEKIEKNKILKSELLNIVQDEIFLTYTFTKLKTIGIIDSPDHNVRIFNWNIEQDDESQKYECIVLYKDKKRKKYLAKALTEIPLGNQRPTDFLTDANWYGALYYQIIPIKKGHVQCTLFLDGIKFR